MVVVTVAVAVAVAVELIAAAVSAAASVVAQYQQPPQPPAITPSWAIDWNSQAYLWVAPSPFPAMPLQISIRGRPAGAGLVSCPQRC